MVASNIEKYYQRKPNSRLENWKKAVFAWLDLIKLKGGLPKKGTKPIKAIQNWETGAE